MYPLSAGLVIGNAEVSAELRRLLEKFSVRVLFEIPGIPEDWADFLDRVERVAPDVLLLDAAHLRCSLQDAVDHLKSTRTKPAVFALDQAATPDAILAALRAGASEFLYPPFEEALKTGLQRLATARERDPANGKAHGRVLAFLSAKGGCGATTVASHVAYELLRHTTGKVLLADLDLQSGIIGFLFKTRSPYTVSDAAANVHRLDQSYWKAVVSNGIPRLEVIAAPSAPSAKGVDSKDAVQVLAFARTQYEWTVLDLGRNLTPFSLSMIDMADQTFVIATPEIPALHEARNIIATLLEGGYGRSNLHLILNRAARHSEMSLADLEGMLGAPVYASIPSDYPSLQEAYAEGRMLDSRSALGRTFARLTAKIAGVSEPKKKLFSLFG